MVRVIITRILDAIRKIVPFNAQNNPMYEMGSIVMLVLHKMRRRFIFWLKVAKLVNGEGSFPR